MACGPVDVAASTADQHRIHVEKLVLLIGTTRLDALEPATFIDVVAKLQEQGTARETIRKTMGTCAMVLDRAGIEPNTARNKAIKLPREEPRHQPSERRARRATRPRAACASRHRRPQPDTTTGLVVVADERLVHAGNAST